MYGKLAIKLQPSNNYSHFFQVSISLKYIFVYTKVEPLVKSY